MIRFLLASVALAATIMFATAQNQPPGPPVLCTSTASFDATTQGTTQIVAAVTDKRIYVCGFIFNIGTLGSTNFQLRSGTGSNCITGQVNLTPSFFVASAQGIVDSSSFNKGIITAASQALCLFNGTTVSAQGLIYYSQF